MNKFNKFIEDVLFPLSQKLSDNKYLIALRDGLMLSMPILIIGSLCIVIGDFPVPAFQTFMGNWLGEIWGSWCWDIMFPATMGLVALFAVIGVSYSLANENKVEQLPAVAIALSAYFILLVQVEGGGFSGADFEAKGLFAAMLTAIVSTSMYSFIIKKKWVIKMPEAVPSFVSRQFTALIPAAIILPIFLVTRIGFAATEYGSLTNFVIQVLQLPLTNIGTSLMGTLVASFFNSFLWLFGIHGTAVVGAVMDPLWYAARYENLSVFQQSVDAARPFIATMDYANFFIFLGGTGLTLPLAFLMAFKCKSQRIKSLGKLSLLPGLFNVNEPVIFGLPIVLNPVMIIPFFLAPTISVLVSYTAMNMGIVPFPTGVTIPWTTPAPIGGWLMCNSWRGGALQIVVLLLSGLIYYPFIRTLDKRYLMEEVEKKAIEVESK